MIRVQDVIDGYICLERAFTVTESDYIKFSSKYKPEKDDVVVSRVGSFGRFALIPDGKCCLGQNVSIIHPLTNKKYIYYYLKSQMVKEWVSEHAKGAGHKAFGLSSADTTQ